jgi:hypothetical protein
MRKGAAHRRCACSRTWKVGEDALNGPGGRTLKRLPAHRAFWFGWYSAFPDTRLVK